MAERALFIGFEMYKLTGIKVTEKQLGHGSYATVHELEYIGLKCAGKKIHDVLLEQGDTTYTVRRFEEECRLLSQVRHPNIVQFLGVYFQQGQRVPTLVMEFLPTNLTSCIERYGILPKEISYSILHDVALGLCYLHSQTPPIIHRDLSSNNVLLTANMTAKISDLGVARILNLSPLQVTRMTNAPGTPAYMPPEVMIANPRYNTSIDEFSYGVLMIHMFSGQWPEPQVGPTRFEDGHLVPVTEAERREVFLRAIGNDHPLMDLILKCVNNDPSGRAHASELVERLAEMSLQFPASFANRLEMLSYIKNQEDDKLALREQREAENHQNQQQISTLREEAQKKSVEITQLSLVHSLEVQQQKVELDDLYSRYKHLSVRNNAQVSELKTELAVYHAQIEKCEETSKLEKEELKIEYGKQIETLKTQIARQSEEFEAKKRELEDEKLKEKESCIKLTNENHQLQVEIYQGVNSLQQKVSTLEADILRKDASLERRRTELEAMTKALEDKETSLSDMNRHLSRAREHLSSKQQVAQANITWKQIAELPVRLNGGKTIVIDGNIYRGGVNTDRATDEYLVYCYDQSQDNWTTLPPLPVRRFGLGQVNGQLVAIGGLKKSDDRPTNKLYTFEKRSNKWKQILPPMPTSRRAVGVLSLQSALIVAGGSTSTRSYIDTVEIFKPDSSQWYTTDPLPTACRSIALVAIGNTVYALGGYLKPSSLNQALYASIDDLLHNAIPASHGQTTHTGSRVPPSAWKTLPDTPNHTPAAAELSGHLVAIGGRGGVERGPDMKEVYVYSPSTDSWIYISDLPAPLCSTAVAVLSSTELLVIGGWRGGRVNTVYQGTLHLEI